MPRHRPVARDGRVLPYTRTLSLIIIPFLVLAFIVLFGFPRHTEQLFAWTIKATMTSMTLASAYLGGAYFFARVLREKRWNVVQTGFASVALFASLLGVTTILHWDKFNHRHVAFWLWAALYFTTPFLVAICWVANQRVADPAAPDDVRVGRIAQWTIVIVGMLALAQGLVMFIAPAVVIPVWPWMLTPLTCRVVGSIFCLGSAGIMALIDPRWSTLRLMFRVEIVMITLILISAARAWPEFDLGKPLTWLLLAGFLFVLVGSLYLSWTMAHRLRSVDPPRPEQVEAT
jgi:hypothetical protein